MHLLAPLRRRNLSNAWDGAARSWRDKNSTVCGMRETTSGAAKCNPPMIIYTGLEKVVTAFLTTLTIPAWEQLKTESSPTIQRNEDIYERAEYYQALPKNIHCNVALLHNMLEARRI